MKSDLILFVENYLKSFALGPAVERATIQGPLYTSKDVWEMKLDSINRLKAISGK